MYLPYISQYFLGKYTVKGSVTYFSKEYIVRLRYNWPCAARILHSKITTLLT